jgi:hypothetical protein
MIKELTYICEWQTCVLQGDYGTLGTKPEELVGPLTDQLPTTRSEPETTHSASPHNVREPGITQINLYKHLNLYVILNMTYSYMHRPSLMYEFCFANLYKPNFNDHKYVHIL